MDFEHLTKFWPVLLALGSVLIAVSLFYRWQARRQTQPKKYGFVLATAGCVSTLMAIFYIAGIVSSIVSVVCGIYRTIKGH
jgi:hypothetical protein